MSVFSYVLISVGLAASIVFSDLKTSLYRWGRADSRGKVRFLLQMIAIALFVFLLWPLLIVLFIFQICMPKVLPRRLQLERAPVRAVTEPEFRVLIEHCSEPLRVDEVEYAELIHDPLQAVPNLPFGHLHIRWQHLRNLLEPGRTLRRFAVPRRGESQNTQVMHLGLVVMDANENVISYWVNEWEQLT